MLTEAEARATLESMVANTTDPVLSTADVDRLMSRARRADVAGVAPDAYVGWKASTVYAQGATVVPDPRNGYFYKVTTAGTSGATQPTWPTGTGGTVTDGGTLVWTRQETVAWALTVDLAAAAAEGWRWKAGRCSNRFAFSADGERVDHQQVMEHCLKMADYYARQGAQSIAVPGSLAVLDGLYRTEVLAN